MQYLQCLQRDAARLGHHGPDEPKRPRVDDRVEEAAAGGGDGGGDGEPGGDREVVRDSVRDHAEADGVGAEVERHELLRDDPGHDAPADREHRDEPEHPKQREPAGGLAGGGLA